ncbi:MAG: enoyl-CoA hydratase/isomerase family protein [Stellaceae bacterium]
MATVLAHQYGAIGWITFNRPQVLNAINYEVFDAFDEHLARFVADSTVRAVAITGAGRAFSAGADISLLAAGEERDRALMMRRSHVMMAAIEAAPKPVIAAVNGIAAGGGFEVALSCDFILAERSAGFGMTEIRYGFLPGGGGTQRLPRRLSRAQAAYLLMSGDMLTADRAAALGLVMRVVEDGMLAEGVREFAAPFIMRSPVAIAQAKRLVRLSGELPLSAGLEMEVAANVTLLDTNEAREAMAAFLARKARAGTDGKDKR